MAARRHAQHMYAIDTKKLAGYVLWGVGGAALVTSGVLFIVEATSGPRKTKDPGVSVSPVAGGAVIMTGGRF